MKKNIRNNKEYETQFWILAALWGVINIYFFIHYVMLFKIHFIELPDVLNRLLMVLHKNQFFARLSMLFLLLAISWLNPNPKKYRKWTEQKKFSYKIGALIFSCIFCLGYINLSFYNIYLTPVIMVFAYYFVFISGQLFSMKGALKDDDNILLRINSVGRGRYSLSFETDLGPLVFPEGTHGFFQLAAPGGGKTEIIKEAIRQLIQRGFSGWCFDYEGNPLQENAKRPPLILTKLIYTYLKKIQDNVDEDGLATYSYYEDYNPKYLGIKFKNIWRTRKVTFKDKPVQFAFINFTDMLQTKKYNFYNPIYHKDESSIVEMTEKFMLAVDPELTKKQDFWGKNGLTYASIIALKLFWEDPKKLTLGHFVSMITANYVYVMEWLRNDEKTARYLTRRGSTIFSAYDTQGSGGQLAGSISSGQAPFQKLIDKNVFYVTNPTSPEEEVDLRLSHPDHPTFLSVGYSEQYKGMITGPLSVLLSCVISNFNTMGNEDTDEENRDAAIFIDEIFALNPNAMQIAEFAGVARKKGIIMWIAGQLFDQIQIKIGDKLAVLLKDNASNQLLGKSPSEIIPEKLIKKMGTRKVVSESLQLSGDGGTESFKEEPLLKLGQITNQKVGHFTGEVSQGDPEYFHCQFDYIEHAIADKLPQMHEWTMETEAEEREYIEALVDQNIEQIFDDIDAYLEPIKLRMEEEAKRKEAEAQERREQKKRK